MMVWIMSCLRKKNGKVVASKYDSTELKFHTPNIGVVFSNEKPYLEELVLDWWQIFKIEKEDLIDVSEKIFEKQQKICTKKSKLIK